ncbi:MAG TPA: hypothetical protein EYQ50_22280 [Verrucomicrobiales bacterium]|nr:hypothetical protein [Verrucomicrobiales bacterium]
MYRKRYPPDRYVFYPLYRYLRRGIRMPVVLAYLMVWSISAVLHAALMLMFGHPVAALVFALLFLGGAWLDPWRLS